MAKRPTVIIVGGGVAGMTAAHELKQRGFSVHIYERQDRLGGKARSGSVPPNHPKAPPDIWNLPSEHGFRFFPGFYQHLIDTLRRIPAAGGGRVLDHLVTVPRCAIAQAHAPFCEIPTRGPRSVRDGLGFVRGLLESPSLGLGPGEAAYAAAKLVAAMTACEQRRRAELDDVTWWDYMNADRMSAEYRRVVINGLTQNFVAMDAKLTSVRTAVTILARLMQDFLATGLDRILDGPTSEVWIDPWESDLTTAKADAPAVTIHKDRHVKAFQFDEASGRITGLQFSSGGGDLNEPEAVYVAAVPVEAMVKLLRHSPPELCEHAPSLKLLSADHLQVNWMSGILFYVRNDTPMCPGHIIYLDSTWAITSVSQNQFWKRKVETYGQGKVHGIVSAIISDWFKPGNGGVSRRTAQAAEDATEISAEALAQIRQHLREQSGIDLSTGNVAGFFLDTDLIFHKHARRVLMGPMPAAQFVEAERVAKAHPALRTLLVEKNLEPLFINTVGSWQYRPREATEIENFFLASDYVRTDTDLATMEGANEAARRAVNRILDLVQAPDLRCRTFSFDEPAIFEPAKMIDRELFRLGLPHPGLGNLAAAAARSDATRRARLPSRRLQA